MQFFLSLNPPTTTHQMKAVRVVNGKPHFYEPRDLAQARATLMACLSQFRPSAPIEPPIRLTVKWLFPLSGKHRNGEYRTSRPDTDNLQKLLKDCMTRLGFWRDDAEVASEIVEKFWADTPGIFVSAVQIPPQEPRHGQNGAGVG